MFKQNILKQIEDTKEEIRKLTIDIQNTSLDCEHNIKVVNIKASEIVRLTSSLVTLENLKIMNTKIYDLLLELIEQRKNSDNCSTTYPIWLVQTKFRQYVREGHGNHVAWITPDGDTVVSSEWDDNEIKESMEKLIGELDYKEDDLDYDDIKFMKDKLAENEFEFLWYELYAALFDLNCAEYVYENKTVAYFLSEKEAQEYLKYQKHNLCDGRIYVDNIGYNNNGLTADLLKEIDSYNGNWNKQ
jgi:hypothetical protein